MKRSAEQTGWRPRAAAVIAALALAGTIPSWAQGILTVTPGATVATTAGTGAVGFTGDSSAATAATLASPAAVARDSAGNLYIADSRNNVVRRVSTTGIITTVAGSGTAGFAGDGAAATAALLDTPTGVAVDAAGSIYIADSHNHRIRKVTGANIATVAGNGNAAFSGDGAAATAASLNLPSSVAVDAAGSIYIADTNNQRIRKVTGTIITTVAGTGEQTFSGDGGPAIAATLDSPSSVAVDATGVIYIADRNNLRIRTIGTTGTIQTIAGNGAGGFSGAFNGDGGSATAASLAKPTGVSVAPDGRVFIADTNNQRIREVGSGSITTVAGSGNQGFAGDNGSATASTLDTPRAASVDASGNVAVADTGNQRIRLQMPGSLSFGEQAVGTASAAQPITLSNTGSASLTISQLVTPTGFIRTTGGTCSTLPIVLAAGTNCTFNIAYAPTASGLANGTLSISGAGVPAQTVLLAGGAATAGSSALTLTADASAPFVGQTVTFTAAVQTIAGSPVASGTVTFTSNGNVIGTSPLAAGVAQISTKFAAVGAYAIAATYTGDSNYKGSVASLAETALDFSFMPNPVAGSGSGFSVSVIPGTAGVFSLLFQSPSSFPYPIHVGVTGLPSTANYTLTSNDFNLANGPATVTLAIQTTRTVVALRNAAGGPLAMAALMLPFAFGLRRRTKRLHGAVFTGILVGSTILMGVLTGCGSGTGFFGQPVQSYNITVTATAQGPNGATLEHDTNLTLTVQ